MIPRIPRRGREFGMTQQRLESTENEPNGTVRQNRLETGRVVS